MPGEDAYASANQLNVEPKQVVEIRRGTDGLLKKVCDAPISYGS